ncbi:MAG: nitroreductase family protein [Chloroflexi bacterium]|nr:nitroreductase family protein [Chloroflexota bacterium]
MQTLDAIRTKRAVRKYTDQPVPENIIRAILNAGRRSQSSKNTQPWDFVVVRDRARLEQLAACGNFAAHLSGAAFAIAIIQSLERSFDIGQTAAYMQLAAWDLGVSSCIASIYEPERAKQLLGVPAEKFFVTTLAFGYASEPPREKPKPGARRAFDDVVHWEKW